MGALDGRVALVTGAGRLRGIGRATAMALAELGADVVVTGTGRDPSTYPEDEKKAGWRDVESTAEQIRAAGRRAMTWTGDVSQAGPVGRLVDQVVTTFGRLDVLVNNAAEQHPQDDLERISAAQLERTFRTNVFGAFFMAKAALPHLGEGASIINTTSVTAYRGSGHLLDYASTKGALVAFTRSLSQALSDRRIRVNAVAPGPIWTPLIASTFPPDEVKVFGSDTPLGRAGEPDEVSPSFVFLASDDASYMTGQVLHPNGGEIVNG